MWLPACICVNKDGSKFVLVHSFHAFLRENNGVFRVGLRLVVIFCFSGEIIIRCFNTSVRSYIAQSVLEKCGME